MKPSGILGAAMFVVALGSFAARANAEPSDAFERTILEELRAMDAGAVDLFVRANEARERDEHAAAARLYSDVVARAPRFLHAQRRQCGELVALGQRAEGVALCRAVVRAEPNATNLAALAHALMTKPKAEPTSKTEADEIRVLLARAASDDPNSEHVFLTRCEFAVDQQSVEELESCSRRLDQIAPEHTGTIYMSWLLAITQGRWSDADEAIAHGRRSKMDSRALDAMQSRLDESRPWTDRAMRGAIFVFLGWATLMAGLTAAGVTLSRATLRHAESWSTSSEVSKRGAALRGVYRGVLFVCCALYYASLPLVLVTVVGGAGALIYGLVALGHIPIKLVLIVVLMAFATCAAAIKSLFWRPPHDEPGLKVDLSREPSLRAALDEVAARVGTRAVDTVYMAPNTAIAVFEQNRGERCLLLGAAVLEGMPMRWFKAILAHEYGHFSNRDTAGGGFALRVRRSLLLFILGLARSGHATPWNPAWWFARGFYLLFLRISQGASRLQEILADRSAAEAYGGDAFAHGLRHVISCSVNFDTRVEAEVNRAVRDKSHLANLWGAPPAGPQVDADKIGQAMSREPSPYDSHPAPSDRIRWVERIAAGYSNEPSDDALAWHLFTDRARQEREMTLLVYQRLAMNGVRLAPLPD